MLFFERLIMVAAITVVCGILTFGMWRLIHHDTRAQPLPMGMLSR
jgi:hypothetical protein